ncbi:MAG TPA: ATP-binding cassette domain-containing protein [Mycobacteriales bacterium]|nr:ATP-binding cassette domain-containing protein [Mycobacteriales bacterium]
MLELQGVSKRYGDVAALSRCSFQVRPGRLTGFVGPNGAGKTTAMRAIFGLVIPDAGTVSWQSQPVTAAARRRFGYMPEERGLYPRMGVADPLVLLGRLSGLTAATAIREADRWLDVLGLADRKTARLDDLSHGNQQRVQLAAALVHSPELLVLDEPFSGLDPLAMDAMSRLLADLAHAGAAVLFSSHQLDVVEHLCEDVVVIDRGHVVLTGDLNEIRDSAPDRYLDVTVSRDPERLLHLTDAVVVAHDGARIRLRVGRHIDPVTLVAGIVGDVQRLTYEPPTLSELFRTAVSGKASSTQEVSGVAG